MLNKYESALLGMAQVWFNRSDIGAQELESHFRGLVHGDTYCGGFVSIPAIIAAYHESVYFESLVD